MNLPAKLTAWVSRGMADYEHKSVTKLKGFVHEEL